MLDKKNHLILVKGEDKTDKIESWRYEKNKAVVWLNFGGKEYPYKASTVQFFKNPKVYEPGNAIVMVDKKPRPGIKNIQFFEYYARLNYDSGFSEVVPANNVAVINSALYDPECANCFDYLKQIAKEIGVKGEDGKNILANRYEKIEFIHPNSVLAAFLKGKFNRTKRPSNVACVFPFGFNLSQKEAANNALNNNFSIIEGPPGTGKTQTILNIIANAVMCGETVGVVSSNNSATANVLEKLKKYGIDFIAAPLGNTENKENFIDNLQTQIPDISKWKLQRSEYNQINETLKKEESLLDQMLALKNERSELQKEQDAIENERFYYDESNQIPQENDLFTKKATAKQILLFTAEYELTSDKTKPLGFRQKLRFIFKYGLKNIKQWEENGKMVISSCYALYYQKRLEEIAKRINAIDIKLGNYDFDHKMKEYSELSMKLFKACLAEKYGSCSSRRHYTAEDLWRSSSEFLRDYPVVLSTTYSLTSSLSNRVMYDYVIMDEASQVDLVSGALSLSLAQKAVIVGDQKQLPNVVTGCDKEKADKIFEVYHLKDEYRYSSQSLLSAAVKLFPDAPHTLLKEHYRCHPEIIGFCNERFYNGELIVLTECKNDISPLSVFRTVRGNHARGHVNQRQIDVITQEVIPNLNLNTQDGSIGIVTPYRDQANELQKVFAGTAVKADTADKFQGQEKSVIIFSTVDNEIKEFASNPNRLNVAVSRAIDRFIVVTDGNDNDSSSPIHDLIGYIQYQNHEVVDSEISSVFDYLYKDSSEARKEILKKFGRISEYESENLMYNAIRDILSADDFSQYDVASHVPLSLVLRDKTKLDLRELEFATNHLTHVDFLIFSKITHLPVLVIEVDGFAYHKMNEKQLERDKIKDGILMKYNIPIERFSTVGSGEKQRITNALKLTNK